MPLAAAALLLVLGASACGGRVSEVRVGGHTFDVPAAYLEGGADDALNAVLDPEAPPPERVHLSVEPAARLCAYRTPPVIDQLPRACAVARGEAKRAPSGTLTRRPRFPDDPTQYDYHGQDGGVVASCTGGSCTAIYAWRDLIWSATMPEARVAELEEVVGQVERLLDRWSAAAGRG